MDDLTIDAEFAALCPEQSAEELANLEFSLEKDGCLSPIVTWANHDDTILDGHTRYRICTRENIPFKTKSLKLATREDAINWIIAHQLGRRNLSDEQKSYLRGKRYLSEKLKRGRPEKSDTVSHLPTAEKLGEEYGVDARTIHRDADFAEAVDAIAEVAPEVKSAILGGKSGVTRKEVEKVAALPEPERKEAAKALTDPRDKSLETPMEIKSDSERIIDLIDRAIGKIDALAAREMSKGEESKAAVACLKDAIGHIKKWRKPRK